MSDLIRREDALKAAEAGPSFYMIQTDTGFRESRGGAFAIRSDIAQALAALPAVQPDDKATWNAAIWEAAAAWAVEGGDRWTRSAAQDAILALLDKPKGETPCKP